MSVATADPRVHEALARANHVRLTRAALKRDLAAAPTHRDSLDRLAELVEDPPPELHGMRLVELVAACYRMGPTRAAQLLRVPVLSVRRQGVRIGDVTPAERARVLVAIENCGRYGSGEVRRRRR